MSVINQQVYAAPGVLFSSISGGGGGGGGVTADPSFSSITLATGSGGFNANNGDPGTITWTGQLLLTSSADETGALLYNPSNGAVGLELATPAGDGGVLLGADGGAVFINSIYSHPINIGVSGGGAPVVVSSLSVSSINGAAPGGGGSVPGNLSVSSLTLQGDPVAAGGVLNIVASDTDLYNFSVSSATTYADFNLGVVGGRQQMYADTMEAPNFYTSTIKGATGQISLNPDGVNQIQIGGTGAPGDILITTTGGGNIKMAGATTMSNAVSMPTTASISSLTASSINGSVYPPPPAAALPISTTGLGYTQQFNSISFAGGLLQSVSSVFSTATISTNNFFQMVGGIMGEISIQGSGNTNPLNNSTNTGFSHFSVDLLVDEGTPNQATLPILDARLTSAGNSSPAQNQAWRAASWSTINYPASFIVQSNVNTGTPYPYGQECSFLQFGQHTYKFLYGIDCFLNSGDPGAGYNVFVQWPTANTLGNAVYQ
jgi:hypothetical protein